MPKFENNSIEHKMLELFNNSIGERIVDDEFEPLMRFMKDNMSEFKKSIHPDKICEYISEIINNKS